MRDLVILLSPLPRVNCLNAKIFLVSFFVKIIDEIYYFISALENRIGFPANTNNKVYKLYLPTHICSICSHDMAYHSKYHDLTEPFLNLSYGTCQYLSCCGYYACKYTTNNTVFIP